MFYAVIHRPETDLSKIEDIARVYDPSFALVGPHVTLVFPFASDSGAAEIIEHVRQVAEQTARFEVRLNELELAWDQWLFLPPSLGRDSFQKLHDDLYRGMLQEFLRSDIEYIPHLALGHFAAAGSIYDLKDPTAVPLDTKKYQTARAEIEALNLDLAYTATAIELISIDDKFTKTETVATFDLKH